MNKPPLDQDNRLANIEVFIGAVLDVRDKNHLFKALELFSQNGNECKLGLDQ